MINVDFQTRDQADWEYNQKMECVPRIGETVHWHGLYRRVLDIVYSKNSTGKYNTTLILS